jgi:hypothetical protein
LRGACLIGVDLRGADLRSADFIGADFRDADIRGADLSGGMFLTPSQLCAATGDRGTRLPRSLSRPTRWLSGAGAEFPQPRKLVASTRRPRTQPTRRESTHEGRRGPLGPGDEGLSGSVRK